MKKIFCSFMILSVLVAMTACRSSLSADPSDSNSSQPSTIGIPSTLPTTTPLDSVLERPESIYTQMADYYAKLYTHSSEDLDYVIRICLYEDNTYSIQGSLFSSFLHQGCWQMDGDILILGSFDQGGYYFQVTEAGLVFLADRSAEPDRDIAMKDGDLFTEHTPMDKTATISVYSLTCANYQSPAYLYLFEGGYYTFLGPAVLGIKPNGSWAMEDDILHLHASLTIDNKLNWYFRMEDDSVVFLAENSSSFPLNIEIADGDKMLLIGEPMTTYSSTFYICQPASGGSEVQLRLYDCQYYEMTGPNHSSSGYWYIDGETLHLGPSYLFHITDDGLTFLADQSSTLKGFVNGDFFSKTAPHYGKIKEYYYTAPAEGKHTPFRLYLYNNSRFSFILPDPVIGINGSWSIEGDVLTLSATIITEDHRAHNFSLYFQLRENEVQYLPDLSDPLPEGITLPEDLILHIAKAAALP